MLAWSLYCSTHERKVFAMIEDPRALITIFFYDWDDKIIGTLFIPKALRDARAIVDLFVEYNMVHPDLQVAPILGRPDPWAEERARKRAEAKRDFPRREVYPVETIIPALTPDGKLAHTDKGTPILYHELHYEVREYKVTPRGGSFRPSKKE